MYSIDLTARVLAPPRGPRGARWLFTLEQMCEICDDVSERTVRRWQQAGLPTVTKKGKTLFPLPEAMLWFMCYRAKIAEDDRSRSPKFLAMDEVFRWHAERQRRASPGNWVSVPLEWDHPCRAELLRIAAVGREVAPELQ